jgi:3-carboxy-cis,cis-muconate cycloisomerase
LIYAENISMALSNKIGKTEAHQFVEMACKNALQQDVHLLDYLLKEDEIITYFNKKQLLELFKPQNSLDLCRELVDKVVSSIKIN